MPGMVSNAPEIGEKAEYLRKAPCCNMGAGEENKFRQLQFLLRVVMPCQVSLCCDCEVLKLANQKVFLSRCLATSATRWRFP
jgi:hypothetical protein